MKVKINITVDVDPAAWTSNYGIEGSREIREDVRTYAENMVSEQLRDLGLLSP